MIIKDKYSVEYNRIIHGDYSIEVNKESHRQLLDKVFITADDTVKELLVAVSEGQALMVCTDVIKNYSLFKSEKNTFKKHMQYFIK